MNMLSVLDYAVNVLNVKHVIVCGYYSCGGIKASMGADSIGIIDNWIRHIKDVYRLQRERLDSIVDESERFNKFVKFNVIEKVFYLAKTSIAQSTWKSGKKLSLHGRVYRLNSGFFTDLNVNFDLDNDLNEVFKLKF